MAPSPIPAPLPPWARALLQLAPLIQVGLQEVLQYIGTMHDAASTNPDAWMHIQMVGKPVTATERADEFVTTMDIVNITGGAIDDTWNQQDLDSVSTQLKSLMTNWAPAMSADYTWTELRFYRQQFNPLSIVQPIAKSGPPVIVYPAVIPGTQTSVQAPQVSLTSTDRTPYARHWGRNYWPHPAAQYVVGQHATAALVDSLANNVHTCYQGLMAGEFFPVVVVTQVDKVPTRGLLTVSEVQVDDLFDVVRRRRPRSATYRKVLGLP